MKKSEALKKIEKIQDKLTELLSEVNDLTEKSVDSPRIVSECSGVCNTVTNAISDFARLKSSIENYEDNKQKEMLDRQFGMPVGWYDCDGFVFDKEENGDKE